MPIWSRADTEAWGQQILIYLTNFVTERKKPYFQGNYQVTTKFSYVPSNYQVLDISLIGNFLCAYV